MKKRANLNGEILEILKERYGFGFDYIRKALRGDRTGIMPDKLREEYKKMEHATNQALVSVKNKLNQ